MNLSEASAELAPYLRNEEDPEKKINLTCERLLAFGKFKGLTKVLELAVYEGGQIVLPQDFETLLGTCRAGRSVVPRDPWFRFASGKQFCADPRMYSMDLGDGYVTFRPVAGALGLRLAITGDANVPVTIEVRTTVDQGVQSDIQTFSGNASTLQNEFITAPIQEVVSFKKGRSAHPMILEARFPDDPATWVPVGVYQPRDEKISLRSYSLPNTEAGDVVLALSKKRYRPATEDTDPLPIDSIYVLRLGLEALSYEDAGDLEKASQFWGLARKSLDDALSEHRNAGGRTLPIFVRAAAGKGLRAIR
jgi:hypothetical protein